MGPAEQAEIVELVGAALVRGGVSGRLVIARDSLELHARGEPVAIPIADALGQWALLPPEMRKRKADELAQRLAGARRATQGVAAAPDEIDPVARKRTLLAVGGLFGLLFLIGVVRIAIPRLSTPPPPPALVAPEPDPARAERLARACDAVRDHMQRGASFGPLAREGFVAELWLASKDGVDLRHHPAITGLVAGDKLSPTADDKLAEVIGGEVAITDGLDPEAAARWKGWSTVTIAFRDGFGRAFFEEEERPRFVGLADRVARATGATYGALYARCAHQTARAVGAWFRGPDLAGATAALVYEMGVFSDAKVISSGSLTALRGAGGELANLSRAAEKVEDMVTGVVGTSGGSVTAGPPPTLQFSLAAAGRAAAAAKEIARPMGIAPQD